MAEETTDQQSTDQVQPAPQTDVAGQRATTDAPQPKTYTQAEIDAMMTARLSKAEKAWKKQAEEDKAEALKRAQMDDVEKLKAELADEKARREADRQAASELELKLALAGKVEDVDYAVFLLNQNPDWFGEDDAIDFESLFAKAPSLKPAKPSPTLAQTATSGAGGTIPKGLDPNHMSAAEVAANWDTIVQNAQKKR